MNLQIEAVQRRVVLDSVHFGYDLIANFNSVGFAFLDHRDHHCILAVYPGFEASFLRFVLQNGNILQDYIGADRQVLKLIHCLKSVGGF